MSGAAAKSKTLPVDAVRIDGGTQARVEMNPAVVEDYAAAYAAKADLPPLEVGFDGSDYWAIDCFHRLAGAKQAGLKKIPCVVREGTLEEFRWLAAGANRTHGLRRTNPDKRKAVEMALKLRPELSNRAIADHVGVSELLVREVRQQLETTAIISQSPERVGRDGRTYRNPARYVEEDPDDPFPDLGKQPDQPHPPEDVQRHPDELPFDGPTAPEPPPSLNGTASHKPTPKQAREPMRDALGNELPERLADVFADPWLPGLIAHLERLSDELNADKVVNDYRKRAAHLPYLVSGFVEDVDEANARLATALQLARAAVPHCMCPLCSGVGCADCRVSGYLSEPRHRELSEQGVI